MGYPISLPIAVPFVEPPGLEPARVGQPRDLKEMLLQMDLFADEANTFFHGNVNEDDD